MGQAYFGELERALKREDASQIRQDVEDSMRRWPNTGSGEEQPVDISADPERALAYVMIAASLSEMRDFLFYVAAGPLEDLLASGSSDIVDRIVAEARRTPRVRWMLTGVFPHAVPGPAWGKIAPLLKDVLEDDPMPAAPWA